MANMKIRAYVQKRMGNVRLRLLLLSVALSATLGCAIRSADPAVYAEAARNDPRKRPYVIGVSDLVRVTVWKDPNLSADAPVRPDGTITMPLVGEVAAAGKTAALLQQELTQRLSAFAKDAVVTVAVVEVNSYRFTVAGNVEHPGMFTSRYYVTISEALALAGGPNRYASPDETVLVRAGRRIPIDYEAILAGLAPEQDIVVLAGDSVQVP
jgi:polysaccharide biosynthesis/export protein